MIKKFDLLASVFILLLFFSAFFIFGCSDDSTPGYSFDGVSGDLSQLTLATNTWVNIELTNTSAAAISNSFVLMGVFGTNQWFNLDTLDELYLVVDGNLPRALLNPVDVQTLVSTNFAIDWNTISQDNGEHQMFILMKATNGQYMFSGDYTVTISNDYTLAVDLVDPSGDQYGMYGDILYPTDPTYSPDLNDLLRTRVFVVGGSLKIEFTVADISISWNPPLDFDHVSFSIYFDDPARSGLKALPRLNVSDVSQLGIGMDEWDYSLIAHGWWSKAMNTSGASASDFGETVGSPAVSVSSNDKTITFEITSSMLGYPLSFNGWKIFVSLFDIDGTQNDYRRIAKDYSSSHAYGSPEANFDGDVYMHPYIADYAPVITLSNL